LGAVRDGQAAWRGRGRQQVADALGKRTSHDDALREAATPMLLVVQLPVGSGKGFSRPGESGHCAIDSQNWV
jgi:hypothetical protein